jgi:hypothetical protein
MKLSSSVLRRIIAEEAAKFKKETPEAAAKDTKEVDADEYADTLEKHVDMMKALKIEESRLERRLKKIREEKRHVAQKISGDK